MSELLDAKDAEIALLGEDRDYWKLLSQNYTRENTTLKALLEQAGEGLGASTEALHDCYEDYMHNTNTGRETWERLKCDDILSNGRRTLSAINAATGEK